MRLRNWADKVLWFVLGAIVVGLLTFNSAPSGTTVQGQAASDQERLTALERRVTSLEEANRQRAKDEAAKEKAARGTRL